MTGQGKQVQMPLLQTINGWCWTIWRCGRARKFVLAGGDQAVWQDAVQVLPPVMSIANLQASLGQ